MKLILIGGAPGSGKSTLAARLSRATGLPSLGRDEVKSALTATRGTLAVDSTEVFYDLIDVFIDREVSLIAEHTFERGDGTAPAIKVAPIERWARTTSLLVMWCSTPTAARRANARDGLTTLGPTFPESHWDPPAGLAVIAVDTTGDLAPSLGELAAAVTTPGGTSGGVGR